MDKHYDVIIVGGGPAGIFSALELSQNSALSVLLLEKGKDITRRHCPARDEGSVCIECSPCNLVCGLGGAGAFSDGKLVLSSRIGGQLRDYLGEADTETLIKHVNDVYLEFGAPNRLYKAGDEFEEMRRKASLAELRLVPSNIRHLGTEHCYSVLKSMRDHLASHLEFKLEVMASNVIVNNGEVSGVETESGDRFLCKYLILAPGREGADWLSREADRSIDELGQQLQRPLRHFLACFLHVQPQRNAPRPVWAGYQVALR